MTTETTTYSAAQINDDIASAYDALTAGRRLQYPGGEDIHEDQLDDIVSNWRADGEPDVEGPALGWTGSDLMLPCGRMLIRNPHAHDIREHVRTLSEVAIQIESTGGKPSQAAKDALDAALGDFDPATHVTEDHCESALEAYANDDPDCTLRAAAHTAISIAAYEYATGKCVAESGGNVSDGASFVVIGG